jgi:hypothetical protein
MRQNLTKAWTAEDLARLVELAEGGASVVRAAAALNRQTRQVAKKARQLGKPLKGVRILKAELRSTDPYRLDAQ